MRVEQCARLVLSAFLAHLPPIQARSVFPGPEATLENSMHARAIFWWERIPCSQWHAHSKRRLDIFAIAWLRPWQQVRKQEETAAANNRQPCLSCVKEVDMKDSMIALLIYE